MQYEDGATETLLEAPGLYLTGSDVASLGINGAAIGGAMTAGKVLGGRALGKIMSLGRPGT